MGQFEYAITAFQTGNVHREVTALVFDRVFFPAFPLVLCSCVFLVGFGGLLGPFFSPVPFPCVAVMYCTKKKTSLKAESLLGVQLGHKNIAKPIRIRMTEQRWCPPLHP